MMRKLPKTKEEGLQLWRLADEDRVLNEPRKDERLPQGGGWRSTSPDPRITHAVAVVTICLELH